MKQLVSMFLRKKDILEKTPHGIYIGIAIVFLGICLYEAGVYLVSQYTFPRAVGVFITSSVLYALYVSKNMPLRTKKKLLTQSQKIPFLAAFVNNPENIIYVAFLGVAAVFLYAFYFSVPAVFSYAFYVFIGIFTIFTLYGNRINISNFGTTSFSQKTLLKIVVITLSIFLVFINTFIELYEVSQHKILILLVASLLYIAGFVWIFMDVFSKVSSYVSSRRFRNYALKNTYNFMSFGFISVALVLLLGKFGTFDGVGQKIASYFSPVVVVEQQQPVTVPTIVQNPIQEPQQPVLVTTTVAEVFSFENGATLGDTGQTVLDLQQVLGLLGTYTGSISGNYDEQTRDSLTATLIGLCDWPDTTRGIFGPLAQECVNSLEIQIPVDEQTGILSDEAFPEDLFINPENI